MKKLLYISDAPTTETGFARVTEAMLDVLRHHFDVYLFGVNYYNEEHQFPYPIFPASGPNLEKLRTSPYGDAEELQSVFKQVQPDIVVANNDSWVVNSYASALEAYISSGVIQFFGYVPVDGGPYHRSLVQEVHSWTGVATYTEFGKGVLEDAGIMQPIKVINHGTNTGDFFSMNQRYARKLLGIRPEPYLVFNGNRNQPRKRYDLMVKGFARFISNFPNDDIGLFAHGGLRNSGGWNVPALLERELQKHDIDIHNRNILYQYTDKPYPHNMVSKKVLNQIYNAMDVGINTCQGEGWGLVNSEHAVTGVPQIVPEHSSLGELFAHGRGYLMPVTYWDTERPYLIERGIVDPEDIADALSYMYENREEAQKMGVRAKEFFTSKELSWSYVAEEMRKWIQSYQ